MSEKEIDPDVAKLSDRMSTVQLRSGRNYYRDSRSQTETDNKEPTAPSHEQEPVGFQTVFDAQKDILEECAKLQTSDAEIKSEMEDILRRMEYYEAGVRDRPIFPQPQATQSKIADVAISPKPFNGTMSPQEAESWLSHFIRYCNFKGLSERDRISIFGLLMQSSAADWYQTLSAVQILSWANIENEFRKSYLKNERLKWRHVKDLWSNPQKADERVDDYILRIRRDANSLNIDDETLKLILLSGLRANIRAFVIQGNPLNLAQTLELARTAEAAWVSDAFPSDINIIAKTLSSTTDAIGRQQQSIQNLTEKVAALTAARQSDCITVAAAKSDSEPHTYRRPPLNPDNKQMSPSNFDQNIRRASQPWQEKQRENITGSRQFKQPNTDTCFRCGIRHRGVCKSLKEPCRNCNRLGHFQRVCRSAFKNSQ
jgi:chorismate mutase